MTIGLILNESKDAGLAVVRQLVAAIRARGGGAVLTVAREFAPRFKCPEDLLGIFEGGGGAGDGDADCGAGAGCGRREAAEIVAGGAGRRSEAAETGAVAGRSGAAGELADQPAFAVKAPCDADAFAGQPAFAIRTRCDALISVGGDGTLIKAARGAVSLGAPILGVNLGALGYLTEVEASEIDTIVGRIFSGDCCVEERMLLSASVVRGGAGGAGRMRGAGPGGGASACASVSRDAWPAGGAAACASAFAGGAQYMALNEIAVSRGGASRVVKLKLYVDGTLLDVYPGDGLLVATPTGSTAYALSAGGPVIDPALSLICVVPICAHAIFSKPVLVAPGKSVWIELAPAPGQPAPAALSVDGRDAPAMEAGDALAVSRSPHVLKMLRFSSDNFYLTLKNKLYRRGEELYSEKG
ncbi:MAG: NAD(+)/NADH kinase [Clostridiales bacterium]|nr:NAD(+)/NADH kinase [Clostridiales bacterium]